MTPAFRRFWFSGIAGDIGGQFTAIALPWMILQLTNDALLMGGAFAMMSLPAAVLSLAGGVLADRYSPKKLMLVARLIGCLAASVLGITVLTGTITMPVIYFVGFLFSVVVTTMAPAYFALVPQLVAEDQLHRGNSMVFGTSQLIQAIGPAMTGALIAALATIGQSLHADTQSAQVWATGLMFLASGLAELVAVLLLLTVATPPHVAQYRPLMQSLTEGLSTTWNHKGIRALLLLTAIAAITMSANQVGVPMLVSARLDNSAFALGVLMSIFAIGSLTGTAAAGFMPLSMKPSFGLIVLLGNTVSGLVFAGLAWTHEIAQIAVLVFLHGGIGGFVGVHTITYVQRVTPREYTGRMISIVVFVMSFVRAPALLAAGFIAKQELAWMFIGAGLLLSTVSLAMLIGGKASAFLQSEPRNEPAAERP